MNPVMLFLLLKHIFFCLFVSNVQSEKSNRASDRPAHPFSIKFTTLLNDAWLLLRPPFVVFDIFQLSRVDGTATNISDIDD